MAVRGATLPIFVACALASSAEAAVACTELTSLSTEHIAITSATAMPAADRPAYCRVLALATPVPDSEIHFEIWLPDSKSWNGKLLGTGNGGYSSALTYPQMEAALRRGYATAGSDTGHTGENLSFGDGHPQKIADWAWRAVHVMTEAAQQVIARYYGRAAAHSYFAGCSTGGQQALTEAQRFPNDYDGIVAGAPGINRIRLNVGFLWNWRALHDGGADLLPASKLPVLHRAVMSACDALDGLEDGVISDPRRCRFDPAALLCRGTDDAECLTPAEIGIVRKIYDGARNPRTGEPLFAGWERGSEGGWGAYFVGRREPARLDFWRYWVFRNPAWDPMSFDFNRNVAQADAELAGIASTNADLAAFRNRGGKIVAYQGWADPVVPPENTIQYYERVEKVTGGTAGFFRLFMVPGMSHCAGGSGATTFDALDVLDQWVTESKAPSQIVASHSTNGKVDITRPLCPWPQTARWTGSGRGDAASQFVCRSD